VIRRMVENRKARRAVALLEESSHA
jgi:hypothetical protein